MATITGTNLSAQLVPFDSQNTYPTHDSLYGRGGWLEAETVAGRNAIPSERLRNGSVCYVEETELPYQYKNGVWNALFTGQDPLEGLGRYTQISYTGTQVNVSAQDAPYAKVQLIAREGNPVQYLNVYGAANGSCGRILVFQTGDITLELGKTEINGIGGVDLQGSITPIYGNGSIFLVEWKVIEGNMVQNHSLKLLNVLEESDSYVDYQALKLSVDNFYPQAESNASMPRKSLMDEPENLVRSDGAEGITVKKKGSFASYWHISEYSKITTPYDCIFDLYAPHLIDSIFVAAGKEVNFNVYILQELSFNEEWEKVYQVKTKNSSDISELTKIPLRGKKCRFIRFAFEVMNYRSTNGKTFRYTNFEGDINNDSSAAGGFTDADNVSINDTVPKIYEVAIYGKPLDGRPFTVKAPVRRKVSKATVAEFISANDQGYFQGRLSGLYANPKIRQFISATDCTILKSGGTNLKRDAKHWGQSPEYTDADIRATRFRLEDLNWMKMYSGINAGWREVLENTYADRGLKPFCTFTSPLAQLAIYYEKYGEKEVDGVKIPLNYINHRYIDKYFTNDYSSMPYPILGYQGWNDYFAETENPLNYKMMAKLAYCIARKYGRVSDSASHLYLWDEENSVTGTNLLSGMEFFNEPDNTWKGFGGYMQPIEFAAIQSAVYDGHCNALSGGSNQNWYGVKNADPDFLSIMPGFVTLYPGYLLRAYIWWMTHRSDKSLPFDIINTHSYFSSGGNQDVDKTAPNLMGCSVEYTLKNKLNPALEYLPRMRDLYMPDKPIWITEIGWGEAGIFNDSSDAKSVFQVRSLGTGKYDNGSTTITPRFRADIKGEYFVRAIITLMSMGYDMCNWYTTENEHNWFTTNRYGEGVGWEMFYWNAVTGNVTEGKGPQYGAQEFSGMGLFGKILENGGYPISRAFWYVKTFRDRFADYVFTEFKKPEGTDDGRIIIAYFQKKEDSSKGAYAVYYLNPDECSADTSKLNRGRLNVQIPLPSGVTKVTRVETYVPTIKNPVDVPMVNDNPNCANCPNKPKDVSVCQALKSGKCYGYMNRNRTALPTSRYERWDGSKWEILNPTYMDYVKNEQVAYAYTKRPADSEPAIKKVGDLRTILPSSNENLYFPIVGPVGACTWKDVDEKDRLIEARQFVEDDNRTIIEDSTLSWRQVDAICDYIEYSTEGQKGCRGIETVITSSSGKISAGKLTVNVTERPEYYFFEASQPASYKGTVTEVSAQAISPSTVKVWWNNTNAYDTGCQIRISKQKDSGYTLYNSGQVFDLSAENSVIVENLDPNTTYYFKVIPRENNTVGTESASSSARTWKSTAISAPTRIYVSDVDPARVKVNFSWAKYNDMNKFLCYIIYRGQSNGSNMYTHVGTVYSPGEFNSISNQYEQSFIDKGLYAESFYSYKVQACVIAKDNTEVRSELSNRIMGMTDSPHTPVLLLAELYTVNHQIILTYDTELAFFVPDGVIFLFHVTHGSSSRSVEIVGTMGNKLILQLNPQAGLFNKEQGVYLSYRGPKVRCTTWDDSGNRIEYETNDPSGLRSINAAAIEDFDPILLQYNDCGTITSLSSIEQREEVVVSIPLSKLGISASEVDQISVEIPKYKYNKKFAFSLDFDDSLASFFNNMVEYIEGRESSKDVKDNLPVSFHPGYNDGTSRTSVTSAVKADSARCFTDGCGNDISFRVGCAIHPYNIITKEFNSEAAEGTQSLYLWKTEIARALDFDHGITNHLGSIDCVNKEDIIETIEAVRDYVSQITSKDSFFTNRKLWYMTRPSNYEVTYKHMTENMPEMYVAQANGYDGYNPRRDGDYFVKKNGDPIDIGTCIPSDLYQSKRGRAFLGEKKTLESRLSVVTEAYERGSWSEMFGHNNEATMDDLVALINSIYSTYGKGGNDSIWFASVNEIFSYILLRAGSVITKQVENGNLLIKVNTYLWKNMWNKEFSLLIKRTKNGNQVSIPSADVNDNSSIYGLSSRVQSDGRLLVNVNFSSEVNTLAQKYLAIFEGSPSEKTFSYVSHFINRMKRGTLRTSIETAVGRLNPGFDLTGISINGGATESKLPSVEVAFTYTGYKIPAQYRLSEDRNFTGTSWKTYSGGKVSFELSSGNGLKTLYAQMRLTESSNPSTRREATITLNYQAFSFTSITINNGASETISRQVNVTFNYLGSVLPAEYRLSEKNTFSDTDWTTFNNSPVPFTLSSGNGQKTLYAQMRLTTTSSPSTTKQAGILFNYKVKAVIALGWNPSNYAEYKEGFLSEGINTVCLWNGGEKALLDMSGENFGTLQTENTFEKDSPISHSDFYSGQKPGSSIPKIGYYPDSVYFRHSLCRRNPAPKSFTDSSTGLVKIKFFVAGTYTIKLFGNLNNSHTGLSTGQDRYGVATFNKTTKVFTFSTKSYPLETNWNTNFTKQLLWEGIKVSNNDEICVGWYNSVPDSNTPLNTIEIEKTN